MADLVVAPAPTVLLFDIDCTLIDTGGAGMAALRAAAVEYFKEGEGPALDLAGSTDSGIVRGLFAHFRRPHSAVAERAFYEVYLALLESNLRRFRQGRVLPGVVALLDGAAAAPGTVAGLLTGNIAAGAAAKMAHFGLAGYFRFGAYGDDHHDRDRLGAVALERARAAHGFRPDPARTVVIGDTPKDIRCGNALGARTAAVATGRFSRDELAAFGPDILLDDLSETGPVLERLLGVGC